MHGLSSWKEHPALLVKEPTSHLDYDRLRYASAATACRPHQRPAAAWRRLHAAGAPPSAALAGSTGVTELMNIWAYCQVPEQQEGLKEQRDVAAVPHLGGCLAGPPRV